MNLHKEARILLNGCKEFYLCFIKTTNKNLSTSDFQKQKISFVYQQLIDIHATHQNTQNQYTRNSLRKPIPNSYSRNWLREAKCYLQCYGSRANLKLTARN